MNNNIMISLCDGILNRFDPLGARCIMGVIEKEGGQFDALLQDRLLSRAEILEQVISLKPFTVWISVQPETLGLLEFIKTLSVRYDGPILIGNVGARGLLTEELKSLRSNIVVVLGQGEDAVFDLYALLKKDRLLNESDLTGIKNLRYFNFKENKLVETANSPSMLAKKTIPSEFQLADAIKRDDVITVRSSSGCQFSCVFCTVRDINNKQRYTRHNQDVLKEHLTMIIRNGMTEGTIRFVDDDLAGDIANVLVVASTFSQLNKEFNTHITFGFSTRAGHFANEKDTPEQKKQRLAIWKNAADAGLKSIFLGLESGSSSQLKRLGKSMKAKYNFDATSIAQSLGIDLEIGFIFIDPFMKDHMWRNEMRDNLKLARHVDVAKTCPTWLAPMRAYEGSPMVTWLRKLSLLRDRIGDTDEYRYDYVSSEVVRFIQLLGPSFCAGKNNGLYDLKREIKYVQWYPLGLDKLIKYNCDQIITAELNFVEELLGIDLYGSDALQAQMKYIAVLEKNIADLTIKIKELDAAKVTAKILACCERAKQEINMWKIRISIPPIKAISSWQEKTPETSAIQAM